MENAQHEKGRKCTYWKMTENHNQKMKEWKMHDMEKGRKCTPQKMTEIHSWKMTEWKMHTQKMAEKAHLENKRMESSRHGKR